MGMDKWPFFEKNIPSDLAEIGTKYYFWTNYYDEKGFGAYIHETLPEAQRTQALLV